jgi:Heavy metal associated domain 2
VGAAQEELAGNKALVVSDTAGRLRVRLPRKARSAAMMARIAREVGERPGISGVSTNSTTGSVTVRYDPGARGRDEIVALLHDTGVLVLEITHADEEDGRGRSRTSDTIVDMLDDADRWLSRLTGRRIDLRTAFPLTLGAVGVWRAASVGLGLSQIPTYVLLWWAFDSFYKLNVQSQRRTADD